MIVRPRLLKPYLLLLVAIFVASSGCNLVPDVRSKRQYHNPFPQLKRVAVLPFANQSEDPTLSGSRISLAYYNELQSIAGFEVLPLGLVEQQLARFQREELKRELGNMEDFQRFARYLNVDAVLQGAITDFDSFYPPRMTMIVNWYAANPGFHPVPNGYGLPWGTKQEKKIPEWIRLESERELAREQLKTQTPNTEEAGLPEVTEGLAPSVPAPSEGGAETAAALLPQASEELLPQRVIDHLSDAPKPPAPIEPPLEEAVSDSQPSDLPPDWPDPQGFIPARPSPQRPAMMPQVEPIMSYMKAYNGNDEDFTEKLSEYFYFRDDARIGGWKSYLQRSEDFIRFCCYLHITETLASRGGELESRLILRWPIDRYER